MNGGSILTRKEQHEKRRQEILAVALDLFIHKGYDATKIQDIAQAADMSVGLLFHYFESKEKLYEELVILGKTSPQTYLNTIEGEPLDFFRTAVKDIIQFVETEPFVAKMFVLMKQAYCNDAAPESVKALLAENESITLSVKKIKQGQKNGTIKEGDPIALANLFWSAFQGIVEHFTLSIHDIPIPDSECIVDILRRRD
jgi:AcrR family transcriptional regulator